MTRYLLRRLGTALLVLVALSLLAFGMVRLIPGDPALAYLSTDDPDPAQLTQIRQQLGLDRSWTSQYLSWLGGVLHGDFGRSLTRPTEISEQLFSRLPVSIELSVLAVLIALVAGIPLGVLAAVRSGRPADLAVRGSSFLLLSIPPFIVATVVLLVNAQTLRARLIGYVPFTESPLESLRLLLLPAIILALPVGALFSRYTRGAVVDALSQDYVRTARAKGAPVRRIVTVHALRNALVPVMTVVGIQLGALIGGTIVIETVFALPGMGSLLIDAINTSDYPTIQGCVLVLGFVYVLINLAVDLLYPLVDPRVRTATR